MGKDIYQPPFRYDRGLLQLRKFDATAYIGRFDAKVGAKFATWPQSAHDIVDGVTYFANVRFDKVYNLYDFVRTNKILELEFAQGRRRQYFFSQDQARAFAVAAHCLVRGAYSGEIVYNNNPDTIKMARKALEGHPLAGILKEPKKKPAGPATTNTMPPSRTSDRRSLAEQMGYSGGVVRGVLPMSDEAPKQIARVRVPVMSFEDLEAAEAYDLAALQALRNSLASTVDQADFARDNVPFVVAQMVVFVHMANAKEIPRYDPNLEALSKIEFKQALRMCEKYLEKYPQLKNLPRLFAAIKQKVGIGK